MAFHLRPGTVAHTVISHLRTLDAGAELSTAELCEALGLNASSLAVVLKPAQQSDLLEARKIPGERAYRWKLGPNAPSADEAAQKQDESSAEIRWAHWDDGDIVIYGLQENDDGSHTIPADVVEAMKRRLAANQL